MKKEKNDVYDRSPCDGCKKFWYAERHVNCQAGGFCPPFDKWYANQKKNEAKKEIKNLQEKIKVIKEEINESENQ